MTGARAVFIRSKAESTGAVSSSSISVLGGLVRRGLLATCEEWRFGAEGPTPGAGTDPIPVRWFMCDEDVPVEDLDAHVRSTGAPALVWIDGRHRRAYIDRVLRLCPESFTIIYAKHPRPWNCENLDRYDVCLVDDEPQVEKVRKRHPGLECCVWDKVIDYETAFYPTASQKIYDLCYVATLRKGKHHELLFEAMGRLGDRPVSCICVGGDERSDGEARGRREVLERMVADLGLSVHFTGMVPPREVNRYINESWMGVMPSIVDAAPRAVLEYMAADVPVLVSADMLAGARYVGPGAGLVRSPDQFHLGIVEILDGCRTGRWAPRDYLLRHFSFEQVMTRFMDILDRAGWGRGPGRH